MVGVNIIQLAITSNRAHGIMIVGNVGGQLVPVIVRVGYVHTDAGNLLNNTLDDQVGISLLAPREMIAQASLAGSYTGSNSASACGVVAYPGQSSFATVINGQTIYPSAGACLDASASSNAGVNYGATLFQAPAAALLNPFTATSSTAFSMDFTQTQAGLVNVTANRDFLSGTTQIFKAGDTGVMVQAGPVYGLLMNGINTQFTAYNPATNASHVNPFLSIGAFVQ
ncbi:DUF2957 domain-containing protein [Paraburkholderia saeva]|uniref:Uncharacterized protein n=1 Tax=Paraburkholderia saeva TaxID=2777537 RepID=A0A9N8RVG4_9BURK|nr:DUF2957 domain-containing protein [Paraburkholderia saeva]CAG4887208.1 hypothetical protein R52603_00360 [Paraburkholderia saeva]CAG4894751.1 hypothetical protein LMG31841_01980 [Paraburkholderia saeva]CAG4898459.1 hypothetical protein R70241_02477 [Paraburkholderia saeva]